MKLIRIVTLFAMVCLAAGQDAAPGSQITVQGLAIRGHAQFEPMPDFTVGIFPDVAHRRARRHSDSNGHNHKH